MGQVVSCFGPGQAGQEQEHVQQKHLVARHAAPRPAATPAAAAVAKLSSDGSPPAAAGQAPEKDTACVKAAAAAAAAADKFVDAADKDDDEPAWSTDNQNADEDFNPGTTAMLLGAEVCPGPWDLNCKGIPLPPNEQARRDTAVALNLFGAAHCAELDFVLETLQRIFDAPYASIALYYNKACWLANTRNLAAGRMMWRLAACPWNCLVKQPQTIVCGDLMEDARFRHQPWIKGGLRCYCSAPLLASNGHRLGTICFMDGVPRKVDAGMCRVLNNFGEIAVRVLERHLQLVQRLEAAHQAAPEQLEAFMHAASKAKPLQRQTSQGLAIQGPDAGNWALANGLQRGNTFDRRASGIAASLSRANSRDDSGCAGRSPADVLLQAAFSRQLRHPDVLLDACVLIVDTSMPGWTILYADETFKQWSGFSRADILGQRLSDVLRPGAPGVAPLNWEAMQSQADAHERFLLSGLVAVNPIEGSTDSSNTQAAAGDAAAAAAAATAATPVADGAAGTAHSAPAAGAPAGAPAAELGASSVLADGAPVGPQEPLLAAAVTTSGEPLGPLATALAREPSYSQASAEYLLEQVQVLEHAHRASVETQLMTLAQASGVQLGHEAAGSFLMSFSSRPHSIPNTSQQLGPGTAGDSMQFTTSGPLMSGAAAVPEGQEVEGVAPASGTLPSPRVFDLTFRPAALDVLDEDTLPLGMPSFVPLEACEPVLRLYVVRLHERLSLPPPPQPLTPSIKLAGRYSSTLSQLSSYLFPGLEIGQVLGRGGYGTAYAGQWHDVHVVVKVEDHELQDAQALRQAQLEISLGQLLRHPNLVRTLGHGAVELPPPPEKAQQREGRQPRPSPPRPRAPAAAPQDARAPAETPASAAKSEGVGVGGLVAAAPRVQGAGREPGQVAPAVQQQPQQDDTTSRVDMTTDSAAFDMFGGQLLRWMTNAEGPGDHFGEDKWMSHCDSADLWRRELLSRTSTWNVELPNPQLMINASSIARDAGASPLSSRTNNSFQGGTGFMVNDKVDVGQGAPHFVMEAIQEEGAPSGSIKSSAQHCVPPRESNSACGVATLEASSTGSHPAASTATVATSSEDAAAPHSGQVEALGSSQQAGSDATPAHSGAATPQQINSTGASDTSAAAVSYHVPLAATAMLGLSPFKGAHDTSSTTGLTPAASSAGSSGKEGPAGVVPSSAPAPHQGHLDGGIDTSAGQASSAAAAAAVPAPAMASAPPAAGASSPGLLSSGAGNGGHASAGALAGSAAAEQGSRLLTSRTSSRDASAEVAALLKSGEMHATRVHAKPMHFPLFLRTFSILEFCDGGTLQDAIDRGWLRMGTTHVRNPPNIPKVLQLALDIARGVAHLHERGVVHADLSANNVLLCKQQHKHAPGSAAKLQRSNSQGGIATGAAAPQPGAAAPGLYTLPIRRYSLAPERPQTADEMEFVAKVSDLGKACLLGADGVVKVGSYATITHSAPEVLRERLLSPAADLYALGVLMWQMYTASRPYASLGHAQIMAVVMHGTLALEWPAPQQLGVRPHFLAAAEQLVQLGMRCLSFEPAHRPTAAEAVEQLGGLLAQVRAHASPAAPAQLQTEGTPQALAEAARVDAGPGAAELRAAGVVFGC